MGGSSWLQSVRAAQDAQPMSLEISGVGGQRNELEPGRGEAVMCLERHHGSVEVKGDMRNLKEYFNILYYTNTFVLQKKEPACIFTTGRLHI